MERLIKTALLAIALLAPATAQAGNTPPSVPPSVPGTDAPQLAALGEYKVGFRSITLGHKAQPDFPAADPKTGAIPLHERKLVVDLWYPARQKPGAAAITYHATLFGEPPQPPVAYTMPGLALADAEPAGGGYPLVIVSHGYSNSPEGMTWLTENLASKGYVVAAIHHDDPDPYIIPAEARAVPNYNRPLDIAFVAASLRKSLGTLIDPANIALIGYSQGGYGVLAAGGASLDPEGPNMPLVAGGYLRRIARGGPDEAAGKVPGVKAIVAMAAAGGRPSSAWGPEGLRAITAPLLLIQGSSDLTVDYKTGALAQFEGATRTDRYLLTFKQGGHAIGLSPAPAEMQGTVWDLDWFEDPVWRKDRIIAINLHFITAFLALNLKGDAAARSWLDVPVTNSDDGEWKAPDGTPWAAYSPGGAGVTLWKGFQRRHASGLELRHAAATK
ncbi:dienelactone hydrolase [Novosphingobium sp.]|uniref:alpha/beta hydrolase family protein n=1 Tax=Novosphingobium sp. TaxID=1874826 RepID=UPI0025CCB83A|nr:dienelactone hydrolase [Novosphingobium sp.]